MREIELKFQVGDLDGVVKKLESLGCKISDVVEQKAGGEGPVRGQGPGHGDQAEEGHQPGAQGGQVDAPIRAAHPGEEEQKGTQQQDGKAIAVAPLLIGDDHDGQHHPAQQEGLLLCNGDAQVCEEAALHGALQLSVQELQKAHGEVHQGGEEAAQNALLPGVGDGALPAQEGHHRAALAPAAAGGGEGAQELCHAACVISPAQGQP